MKLLIVGDLHLRTRPPRRRTEEDFAGVCLDKLVQICKIAEDREAKYVVQVGDFFDRPDPDKGLLAQIIYAMPGPGDGPRWIVIHGQHDLKHHASSARRRSALCVLEAAGKVWVADGADWGIGGVGIMAAGFGQEPPEPKEGGFNTLVVHAMVGDKPLWPGHDLTGPEEYARRHPGWDLYCFGDYHYPFTAKLPGGAWAVNPGAVLRLTADERDRARRPKVVLFDTETRTPEDIPLDVARMEDAFFLDAYADAKAAEERRQSFAAMAEALRRAGGFGVSFEENLAQAFDDLGTPQPIRDRAWDAWRIMEQRS